MLHDFGGVRTIFLMAAEAEYGPELRARITPVMTGVGPVEAAVVATATLAALPEPPDLVITLGSAGSATLAQCGVYQASSVAYRDMDAAPLGFEKGVTPFLDLPRRLPLSPVVPGLAQATLSTGGAIISGAAYAAIAEDMVDMESYAIARACQRFGCPLIVLRGISDGAAPLEGMHSWTEYLDIIDARLAEALDLTRNALESGLVPRSPS